MIFRLLNQTAALIAVVTLVAACQTAEASVSAVTPDHLVTTIARSSWTPVPVIVVAATPIPTQSPSATIQVTPLTMPPTIDATLVPSPSAPSTLTPFPTNTRRPTLTVIPTIARTKISTNVPGPFGGDPATWTPPPPGRKFKEHYVFRRPIGDDHMNFWARNYSYGSTDGGTRPIHHGIDLQNETGTPVLAAGDGVIYYAGPDKDTIFGPQPDFYGNVVVIQHAMTDVDGQMIYTLYGHLSKVEVSQGQKVKVGQEIGLVGSTGVAIGAHLHFEVRAGNPNDYNSTRNPELWVMPYQGDGVVAGRVMDLNGIAIPGIEVEVQSTEVYRLAYSYADNTVTSDPAIGENFAIPDLPAGYYTIFIKIPDSGLKFRTLIYVQNGKTNWIDININLSQ